MILKYKYKYTCTVNWGENLIVKLSVASVKVYAF